jgi:hypothetical protein
VPDPLGGVDIVLESPPPHPRRSPAPLPPPPAQVYLDSNETRVGSLQSLRCEVLRELGMLAWSLSMDLLYQRLALFRCTVQRTPCVVSRSPE